MVAERSYFLLAMLLHLQKHMLPPLEIQQKRNLVAARDFITGVTVLFTNIFLLMAIIFGEFLIDGHVYRIFIALSDGTSMSAHLS